MADTKISALPASTVPLAGTEVLPIVQSSATKQVSVANLTAGRAISATQLTLTTGNLIVASGQGIDFSATPGTGTSELLADYEEGTWTPTLVGSGGGTPTYNTNVGRYTKVGNLVTVNFWVYVLATGGLSGNLTIAGLPYAKDASNTRPASSPRVNVMTIVGQCVGWIADSSSSITLVAINAGSSTNLTSAAIAGSTEIDGTFSYQV